MSADNLAALDQNVPVTRTVPARKTRLQRLRWPLMSLAAISVLGGATYFYIRGGRYQSTDDAYAQAATVSISAKVPGQVSEIDVRDNDLVQRGATLFKLDGAPFRIAVRDAVANLADTRLQIESLKSTYRQWLVELHAARDTQSYARQHTIARPDSWRPALRRRRSPIRPRMRSMRRGNKLPTSSSRSVWHSPTWEGIPTLH